MTKRTDRVNELLKEVISNIIHRTIQFPDDALVTITRVVSSPDLHYANVMITVYATEPHRDTTALNMLTTHVGGIQRTLNKKLRMRPVPRITFVFDKAEARRERIEKLLGETQK